MTASTQPSLFTPPPTPARLPARHAIDALTCIRDAMPDALDIVVHLSYWRPVDNRDIRACGDWAYLVRRGGLRFERAADWWNGARSRGETWGWGRTPTGRITWGQLAELVSGEPRRAEIVAWSDSLTHPDAWRDRARPYELWPNPGMWHPNHIEHDHTRPGWPERIAAWRTLLKLLDDTIGRLAAEVARCPHLARPEPSTPAPRRRVLTRPAAASGQLTLEGMP